MIRGGRGGAVGKGNPNISGHENPFDGRGSWRQPSRGGSSCGLRARAIRVAAFFVPR